ncbi:hypothetical protein C6558_23165 [Ensifer sp. NM-2]|nr:hypothetical protein C6558_23165 [Ensifer sp. NM-2]
MMEPVALAASTPKTTQVDILLPTTHQPSGDPATLFKRERNQELSFAEVAVSIPSERDAGTVQGRNVCQPTPPRILLVRGRQWNGLGAVAGRRFNDTTLTKQKG